jgi:diguanylate cyclase (GGDEF)-like protein
MWVVTVISPWEQPREYVLKAGKTMLGRHPGNDIVLPDDAASRLHAELDYDLIGNTVTLRDLGSTNGTWYNRGRLTEPQRLRINDQVHIGQHLLTIFQRDHAPAATQTGRLPGTQPLAREIVRQSIDKRAPVLYEVAHRLNSLADLDQALTEVSRLARVALSADDCRIFLAERLDDLADPGLPRALLRRAVDQQVHLVVADLAAEALPEPPPAHIHAALAVPGLADDAVVTLTSAYRAGANTRPFEDFDVELAVAISHEVALAVRRSEMLDRAHSLTQLANSDRLTGLHNRRYFLTLAESEFARARRYRRPLAVLLLDVDNFKSINSRHGHASGDQVLRAVADGCRAQLREPHLLCRYGGDEFVVLLLEADGAAARAVADRLHRHLAAAPVDTMTGPVPITVSAAYAVLDDQTPDFAALLNQAEISRLAPGPSAPTPGAPA